MSALAAGLLLPSGGVSDGTSAECPTAEDLQRLRRLMREVFKELTDAKQRCAKKPFCICVISDSASP